VGSRWAVGGRKVVPTEPPFRPVPSAGSPPPPSARQFADAVADSSSPSIRSTTPWPGTPGGRRWLYARGCAHRRLERHPRSAAEGGRKVAGRWQEGGTHTHTHLRAAVREGRRAPCGPACARGRRRVASAPTPAPCRRPANRRDLWQRHGAAALREQVGRQPLSGLLLTRAVLRLLRLLRLHVRVGYNRRRFCPQAKGVSAVTRSILRGLRRFELHWEANDKGYAGLYGYIYL
jgi:hypothetical protein